MLIVIVEKALSKVCMKRIVLISLVSLALFGCEEKKVTEEMLIGDWECDFTQQVAKWKDGAFQEYGEIERDKGLEKYFMKDNTLYFSDGASLSYPFNLSSYNQAEKITSLDDHKIKWQDSIKYISPDKFKTVHLMEYIYTNDSDNSKNIKTKSEFVCERVKQ